VWLTVLTLLVASAFGLQALGLDGEDSCRTMNDAGLFIVLVGSFS